MRSALDVHRDLLMRDVPHEVLRLSRSLASAEDLPEVLGVPPARCVVVRCYVTEAAFAAVLMQAGATADPVALLDCLGVSRARPATSDEVSAATDQAAGLVGPVGLPADVALLSDSALGAATTDAGAAAGSDVLYTATGEPGVALGIRTRDLLVVCGARVATLSVPQPPGQRRPGTRESVIDLEATAFRRRVGERGRRPGPP